MPVVAVRNLQRAIAVDLPLLLRQTVAFRNALRHGAFVDHGLTVNLVSNSHIRRLNARYARADYVTDVLSFRTADLPARKDTTGIPLPAPPDCLPPDLGTVFLAVPLCARRAARHGIPANHYLAAATAHATAHLAGHLHDDAASTASMRDEELRLLRAAAAVTPHLADGPTFPRSYLPAC